MTNAPTLPDDLDPSRRRARLAWDLLVAGAILVGFALLYHAIARAYGGLAGFEDRNNVIFGADHLDALKGWVGNHKGTHPILMLIIVPIGRLFEIISGDWTSGQLLQSAMIGATTVTAFFGVCRLLVGRLHAAAAACVFGVTMTQLTLGCVPDSFELACLSTLPGYALMILCLRRERTYFGLWIVAGVLTFGVTVPNFAQTLFCFTLVLLSRRSIRESAAPIIGLVAAVVAVTAVLALIQHWVVPGSKFFLVPGEYQREMRYLRPDVLEVPGHVAEELFRNVFLYPVVGQEPIAAVHRPGDHVELVYRDAPIRYGWLAFIAAALWLVLLVRGAILSFGDRFSRLVTLAASLAVAANIVLHSFFGTIEIFLFSPHFLAALILVAISRRSMRGPVVATAWGALAVLVAASNFSTVRLIIEQYPGGDAEYVIDGGETWRYCTGDADPGRDWFRPEFDDSAWPTGRSGFGYGDGDDRTTLDDMRGKYSTVYTRREFDLDDPEAFIALIAEVDYDDGFALFLNGTRVLSRYAPGSITHLSLATGDHEADAPVRRRLPREALVPGPNTIAVVGLNRTRSSSDFSLRVRLLRIDPSQ